MQSEFGQLIPDPRTAPGGIDSPHLTDELNQFPVFCRAPNSRARLPSPKEPESCPVPADDGFGSEDQQSTFPTGPPSLEDDPDQPIPWAELGSVVVTVEHRNLVSQGQDLQGEIVVEPEPGQKIAQKRRGHCQHGSSA